MLRRIPIAVRLVVLSLTMIGFLLAAHLYYSGHLAHERMLRTRDIGDFDAIHAVNDAVHEFGDLKYWLADLALSLLMRSERRAEQARRRFEVGLERLRPFAPDEAAAMAADLPVMHRYAMQAVDAYARRERVLGNTLMAQARIRISAIDKTLADLALRFETAGRARIAESHAAVTVVERRSQLIMAAALLFAALATVIVIRSIIGPLERLRRAIRRMAGGELQIDSVDDLSADEVGQMSRAVELFRQDLIERENLLHQHEDARREASEAWAQADIANRAKSNFLANMSHEMRTPLNAIIGFAEVMQQQMFGPIENERYRGYVDDILSSGRFQLELINDILDLAKIEAGKRDLNETVLAVESLFEDCLRVMRPRAEERGVTLSTEMADGGPALMVDAIALKQVLLNLLSNAIKFCRPGGGQVTVGLARLQDGGVEIRISDNGIGIAHADLERVFENFFQADNSFTRSQDGTGLGLSLVRSLIEMHQGTVSLESTPEVGTTAIVRLPPERVADAADGAPACRLAQ